MYSIITLRLWLVINKIVNHDGCVWWKVDTVVGWSIEGWEKWIATTVFPFLEAEYITLHYLDNSNSNNKLLLLKKRFWAKFSLLYFHKCFLYLIKFFFIHKITLIRIRL